MMFLVHFVGCFACQFEARNGVGVISSEDEVITRTEDRSESVEARS